MATTLMSIQMIPSTPNGESVIPYVDQAIAVIDASGLSYKVGPLETTVEGELAQLLSIVQEIHHVLESAGCPQMHAQIKLFHRTKGITIGELTQKYE
ncbi:uncharacterized protein, MTH1187 family [Seinonella peptonophila]|uniref:Uncharacterized protein, MTH1187 family n=1 Tax=Seinonella peptonophila TaxID=112248 RepID=A0A1M5ALI1_9BACL|nr:MTH1187 family thiamine-binding protein [Seinonella peptonophila]SHF30762.1 uncharacterized protein, MTH1187 family [Seinonella peptonophila]